MIKARTPPGGDRIERARSLRRGHIAGSKKSFANPFDPQNGVGIQKDVFGPGIGKVGENRIAEFALQLGFVPLSLFFVLRYRKSWHFRNPKIACYISVEIGPSIVRVPTESHR